jgi:hypothetical protein
VQQLRPGFDEVSMTEAVDACLAEIDSAGTRRVYGGTLKALGQEFSPDLVTIEYRHSEAKGLRGLMQLVPVERDKHPDGFKLVYGANWATSNYDSIVPDFPGQGGQMASPAGVAAAGPHGPGPGHG